MRKTVLSLLVGVILLSNVSIVSAKTINSDTSKIKSVSNVSQSSIIHLNTTDPYP